MNWVRKVEVAIALLVTAILIGYAFAYWIPWCTVGENGCKMGVTEWAYWVAAIGTVGAFFGTIWISMTEVRRRKQEDRDRAMIVASMLLPTFNTVLIEAKRTIEILNTNFIIGMETNYKQIRRDLISEGNWTINDMLALACLPNHAAGKLASARSCIDHVILRTEDASYSIGQREQEEKFIAILLSNLNAAVIFLNAGIKECTIAANP